MSWLSACAQRGKQTNLENKFLGKFKGDHMKLGAGPQKRVVWGERQTRLAVFPALSTCRLGPSPVKSTQEQTNR